MKKFTVIAVALVIATNAYNQQTEPQAPMTKQDYLQKSSRQKTTAWILLGAGAALVTTGIIIGNKEEDTSFDDAETGGIIAAIGAVPMIVSIPVFMASSRNKRKAMELSGSIGLQRAMLAASGGRAQPSPALSLRLSF